MPIIERERFRKWNRGEKPSFIREMEEQGFTCKLIGRASDQAMSVFDQEIWGCTTSGGDFIHLIIKEYSYVTDSSRIRRVLILSSLASKLADFLREVE